MLSYLEASENMLAQARSRAGIPAERTDNRIGKRQLKKFKQAVEGYTGLAEKPLDRLQTIALARMIVRYENHPEARWRHAHRVVNRTRDNNAEQIEKLATEGRRRKRKN
jgi:hypothetical protein